MIQKTYIEELKKIPILEVAIKLNLNIKRQKTMCFTGHDTKTPSLSFNLKDNYWHCFGCGIGGSTIDLVQQINCCTFLEACNWLSTEFDIPSLHTKVFQKGHFYGGMQRAIDKKIELQPDSEVYEWLINYASLTEEAHNYLTVTRKFSINTINYFNIKSFNSPAEVFLKAKNQWGIERLVKCGIVKVQRNIESLIWWAPTILFPFYDSNNRIVYIQGRQIGDKEPKYINLNNIKTQIYNKNVINKIRKNDFLYVCEGIPDVLSAFEYGLNAIGIIGANGFKDEYVNELKYFNIGVIPDNDNAGNNFADKIQIAFNKIGKNIEIFKVPKGKDLCDFLQRIQSKVKK